MLRGIKKDGYDGEGCVLLAWKGLSATEGARFELDPSKGALPESQRVVHFRPPSWTEDGSAVWVGVKEWEKEPEQPEPTVDASEQKKEDKTAEETKPAAVEVWHAHDVRTIPEQKHRAKQDRERNLLAAWLPEEGKFTVLGKHYKEEVIEHPKKAVAVALDWSPYPVGRMFGRPFADLYSIDIRSGERRLLEKQIRFDLGFSPDSTHFVYFLQGDYWSVDLGSGMARNLTEKLGTDFANLEDDHPTDRRRPYFPSLWSDNGSLLVHDEFDVWERHPDGSEAQKLTDGRASEIVHRALRVDREERELVSKRPLFLSLNGKWTKKEGIARIDWSQPGATVERLVWDDKGFGSIVRAEDKDVLAYSESAFDDPPDYFVGSEDLRDARQVSHTDPFFEDYAWGRGQLIEYRDSSGNRLQGALFSPANFEPGEKRPMIVNIYEKRSDELHRFWTPTRENYYNPAVWTAQGYFVLLPDITYKPREPGVSALDCVEAAIDAAVATGSVDAEHVGLVGHSWGGYETAYIATRSKKLAAAVAGAALPIW